LIPSKLRCTRKKSVFISLAVCQCNKTVSDFLCAVNSSQVSGNTVLTTDHLVSDQKFWLSCLTLTKIVSASLRICPAGMLNVKFPSDIGVANCTGVQSPKPLSVLKKYSPFTTTFVASLITSIFLRNVWLQFPLLSLNRPYNL